MLRIQSFHSLINSRKLWLVLTAVVGLIVLWPLMNFQPFLTSGDHGRDLYAFLRVSQGAVPYRDFSWLFGPLMAYYYALFFKIFGASVQSVLWGQNLLVLLTGLFLYLACTRVISPGLSLICAVWYWTFRGNEFFYTYNHSGGMLCLLVVVYAMLGYVRRPRSRYVTIGFIAVFILSLIRLNIAVVALAGFLATLLATDLVLRPKDRLVNLRFYVYGSLACVSVAFVIYWTFLHGLPNYAIWQSFPITPAQRTDIAMPVFAALKYFTEVFYLFLGLSRKEVIFNLFFLMCIVGTTGFLFDKRQPRDEKLRLGLSLAGLFLMAALLLHEFVLSGIFYRIYWAFPVILIFLFVIFGRALALVDSLWVHILFRCLLAVFVLGTLVPTLRGITSLKNPMHLFQIGPTKIYTSQEPAYPYTVGLVCRFIETNVPKGEKVLTLPFDTLYNFFTLRDNPTRQWTFFEHFIVPDEQQLATIRDMERDRVQWVLLSNRAISTEPGLGTFGVTYCHLLWKYIYANYEPAAQFGIWSPLGSWGWNHGVVIFKRKVPFSGTGQARP